MIAPVPVHCFSITFTIGCSHMIDFNARNNCLNAKLLQEAFDIIKFKRPFSDFITDTMNKFLVQSQIKIF